MDMRCCAYIVNLIVSDGLKDLGESISTIRNAVRYIRSSPVRLQKFKLCAQKEKIEYNGLLVLDVPTRWNSTYLMLNVAIKFQQAFDRFEEEDDKYLPFFHEEDGGPKKVGRPLLLIGRMLSATLSVTSNIYYHRICEIQSLLTELWSSGDMLLSKMVVGMQKKFDKYWGTVNGVNQLLFISTVLDSRYKMGYLKYCFGCLYDVDTTASLSSKVIKTLTDLYAFYCIGKGKPTMNSGSGSVIENTQQNQPSFPPNIKFLSSFVKYLEEKSYIDKRNDLDQYLADDNIDPLTSNFDILVWWKENSVKYPLVSIIACDVLAIPISIVAYESVFSTGGRILDSFRSSL
ncbi:hypothetical protein UlMin_016082 [Ulmus minor]